MIRLILMSLWVLTWTWGFFSSLEVQANQLNTQPQESSPIECNGCLLDKPSESLKSRVDSKSPLECSGCVLDHADNDALPPLCESCLESH